MAGKNRNVLKRFIDMKLKGKEIHKRTQPSQKAIGNVQHGLF